MTDLKTAGSARPSPTRAERIASLAWLGATGTLALGTATYTAFFVIVTLFFPGRNSSPLVYALAAAPMLLGAAATWFAIKRYRASTGHGTLLP